MDKTTVLILIALAVIAVLGAIAAYFIVRFMKGTIKLLLPRTAFNAGDVITGSFDLHAKKDIEAYKLIVSLVGVQVTKTYEDGKRKTVRVKYTGMKFLLKR